MEQHTAEIRVPRGVEEVGFKFCGGAPNSQPDYGIGEGEGERIISAKITNVF